MNTARAELKWEQTAIELHPALADKQAIGHFKYENIGKTPVKIKSAKSSCGCTVAQSQKEEIPPGDKGEITATFNIADRIGLQVKNVTVETDDPDPKRAVTVLTLKTFVPEALAIAPQFIYWTSGEEAKPKLISVKADKNFPAKNLTVTTSNADFAVKVEPAAKGEWKISVEPKQTDRAMAARLNIQPDVAVPSGKSFAANVSVTAGPPTVGPRPNPAVAVPH